MSDDERRPPGNVRRVTAKDRKEKLEYGQNLFPPEQPLAPDLPAAEPPSSEPLPFDDSTFAAQSVERFPPLPFDGDEPPQPEQAVERFPPLPTPGWARPREDAVDVGDFDDDLDAIDFEAEAAPPAPVAPPPARAKARKKPAPEPRKKTSRARGCVYNLLTLLFLVLTIGALAYGVHIFNNPYSSLNLLPPPTALPIFITATPGPPVEAPVVEATPTPLTLDLSLMTEEAPVAPALPTATYTPLPPEVLTEMAPAPTQEQAGG